MAPGEKPHRHRDIYERLEKLEKQAKYFYKEIGLEASRGYILKRRVERLEAESGPIGTPKEDSSPEGYFMGFYSSTCQCEKCNILRSAFRLGDRNCAKTYSDTLQIRLVELEEKGD